MTGLHSVIDKPLSVSLVKPPNTTIPNTLAALPKSQYATDLSEVSGKNLVLLLLDCSDWLIFAMGEVAWGLESSPLFDSRGIAEANNRFGCCLAAELLQAWWQVKKDFVKRGAALRSMNIIRGVDAMVLFYIGEIEVGCRQRTSTL